MKYELIQKSCQSLVTSLDQGTSQLCLVSNANLVLSFCMKLQTLMIKVKIVWLRTNIYRLVFSIGGDSSCLCAFLSFLFSIQVRRVHVSTIIFYKNGPNLSCSLLNHLIHSLLIKRIFSFDIFALQQLIDQVPKDYVQLAVKTLSCLSWCRLAVEA